MPAETTTREFVPEKYVVAFAAGLAVALALFRATFGASFYDDSHYVTVALRLAQGARPFVDEMSVQSLGFLPSAAFVWVWTHVFGTSGLVAASRLFYVVAATGVGALVYSQLRRAYRPIIAAMPVAVVLLCPPFNLLAPGYNLMATLGFLAATALAYRALLDKSVPAAGGAGLALAFASFTYPPLALAALVFVGVFAALSRSLRLTVWLLGTSALAATLFIAGLLSRVSVAEIRYGLAYASANVVGIGTPTQKLAASLLRLLSALASPGLWPMWGVAIAASVKRVPDRFRRWLLLAIAPLAAAPGLGAAIANERVFGITASAWLTTFSFGALVPIGLWAIRSKHVELTTLLALTIPPSLVGFLTVAYSTDAGWLRAVPVIGLAPLALAIVLAWAAALGELGGANLLRAGGIAAVVIAMSMLWTTTIDDGNPVLMRDVVRQGPYSGMHVSAGRWLEIERLGAAAKRWVRDDSRVTFFGERQGYLVTGGQIYTNAVWLYPSGSDRFALAYFTAHKALPDVIFTDQFAMRLHSLYPYEEGARVDRFVAEVVRDYVLVDVVDDFGVWVRRM